MGLRQDDLPDLRRERNRSLSRQWPERVPAVTLNMGVGDLNNQRLKTSNAVFQLPTAALHQILASVVRWAPPLSTLRSGWPLRHPSPKKCLGSNIPTTASLPRSDTTVSLILPFWM